VGRYEKGIGMTFKGELKYLYCSHISQLMNTRNMILAGRAVRMKDMRGVYRYTYLMWRPVRERIFGILQPGWEDSKMEV
jgi:hypothetical protein